MIPHNSNFADVTVTPGALKAPQSPPGWVKQVSPPEEAPQGPLFGPRSPSAPHGCHGLICPPLVFASLVCFFLHRPTTPIRLNQVWKENATVWTMEESRWVTLAIDGLAFCDLSVWCHGETGLCHWARFVSPRSPSNAERPRGSRSTVCIVHCKIGEWMKTKSRNDMEENGGSLVIIAPRWKTKMTVLGMNEAKLVPVML